MKTAIAIDSLLFRDDSVFLLELILSLFPETELYTMAHKQGSILGRIETRPIVSSFLTHKIKNFTDFKKNFWLIPSAIEGIPIHSSIEKVIILSRGYIHGLKLPHHVQKYLYILDWDLIDQKQLGWQKIFCPYVNNWREKYLNQFSKIAVSSEYLKHKIELPNAQVITPTFKTEDYSFVRDEDHNFNFTHHLIYTHGLDRSRFKSLVQNLLDKKETIRVLGPDEHLLSLRDEFPQIEFGGDHCEATNALYSHQAKVVWDLSLSYFPSKAFGALATGRPVVVLDNKINRELLIHGAFFLEDFSGSNILRTYQQTEDEYLSMDRKILRRLGLKWNERLFKSKMTRFLS